MAAVDFVKLAYPVKVGTGTEPVFLQNAQYEMDLDIPGHVLKITERKSGQTINTSYANVISWKDLDESSTKQVVKRVVRNVSK